MIGWFICLEYEILEHAGAQLSLLQHRLIPHRPILRALVQLLKVNLLGMWVLSQNTFRNLNFSYIFQHILFHLKGYIRSLLCLKPTYLNKTLTYVFMDNFCPCFSLCFVIKDYKEQEVSGKDKLFKGVST